MRIDLGDAALRIELEIPGHRRDRRLRFHVGAPYDIDPQRQRPVPQSKPHFPARKADITMEIQADKGVHLSGWSDEANNPVPPPPGNTVAWTVDDPSIINLIENGDGTAEAQATGALGSANVHAVNTDAEGATLEGDLAFTVVAGDADAFNISAGAPYEVTPDA